MRSVVNDAIGILQTVAAAGGLTLEAGYTAQELAAAEALFGFRFGTTHRQLLRRVRPAGSGWPDWRDPESVRSRMEWPHEGFLFDVEHSGVWLESWGPRPASSDMAALLAAARGHISCLPKLVPIWGHRYMPDAASGHDFVLSVYQTDVIVYGDNLADYFWNEFVADNSSLDTPPRESTKVTRDMLPPWTRFCFYDGDPEEC